MTSHEQASISPEQMRGVVDKAGYFRLLGLQVEIPRPGVGQTRIEVDERLFHPWQIVHGGVIFTLADTAMSFTLFGNKGN